MFFMGKCGWICRRKQNNIKKMGPDFGRSLSMNCHCERAYWYSIVCSIEMRVRQSHVWSTFQDNVLGTVLLRMRFLWSAGDYLSNCYCAALRAMTVPERERAARLFVVTLPKLSLRTEWQYIKLLAIILLGRSSSRSCHCETCYIRPNG